MTLKLAGNTICQILTRYVFTKFIIASKCAFKNIEFHSFKKMFGEKAFELIKELDRNSDSLPPFSVGHEKRKILISQIIILNLHLG